MMNKIIYSLSFTILLAGLTSCDSEPEKVAMNAPFCTITEAEYSVKDTTYRYEIDLVYPVVDANTTPEILNNINNTISDHFYRNSFQTEFVESHKSLPEEFLSKDTDWFGQLQSNYGVSQCDTIINIWYSIYQYYIGAAHGYTQSYSLHFNLKTGKQIPNTALFKTDSKSLDILQSHINSQLPDSVCWGIETDSAALEVLQTMTLTSDSVIFKMKDYALCPYAFNVTDIRVAREELHSIFAMEIPSFCMSIQPVQDEGEIATH